MENFLSGLILIVIGVFLIAFREWVSKKTIESQNRTWSFHFGEQEIRATKYLAVIVGIGFIILGLDSLQ
jgi:hypothetical protein